MYENYLTIIGSNSAIAVHGRYPSAQFVKIGQDYMLIDCGEGTQFRLAQFKIKSSKIRTILISHLHGDHVFGLPGLLSSFQLSGRSKPLTIVGPAPIKAYLDQTMQLTGHLISYPIEIIELSADDLVEHKVVQVLQLKDTVVSSFSLDHRVPCSGYLIEEVLEHNICKEAIEEHHLNVEQIKTILSGKDVEVNGRQVSWESCVYKKRNPSSYAYCSDTAYMPSLGKLLRHRVHTLYHETTYLSDFAHLAAERGHATAAEAASLASDMQVEHLVVGHFSSRYADIEPFKIEAQAGFEQVSLAREGKIISLIAE